ncbi:MAG: hypothetical protein ACKOXK_06470 [Chakrabartia sp.]
MNKAWIIGMTAAALSGCGNTPTSSSNESNASANSAPPTAETAMPAPAPAPTAPAASLLGEWAEQSCVKGDGDANGDGYPEEGANFSVTANGYSGFEWSCQINPKIQPGQTRYNGTAICYGDGQDEAPQKLSLDLLPDGRLRVKDSFATSIMRRCS